jgi:hypothetical protein
MLEVDLDGVKYLSMASAGGHLRGTEQYRDGWFFGYALVGVRRQAVDFHIKELKPPQGQGRITEPQDWRRAGGPSNMTTAPGR